MLITDFSTSGDLINLLLLEASKVDVTFAWRKKKGIIRYKFTSQLLNKHNELIFKYCQKIDLNLYDK